MFGNFKKSNKSMFMEAIDRANQIAHEFDAIRADIEKASQYSISEGLNKFLREEHNKLINEIVEERPLEKSLADQKALQDKFIEKGNEIKSLAITHARDLMFLKFIELHTNLCANLYLAEMKLIELLELKKDARNRKTIVRRGEFLKNISTLSDENIESAFNQLGTAMSELKDLADRIHGSLLMVFIMEQEASHQDKQLEEFVTKFNLQNRACNHANTAAYQSFKAFTEAVEELDLLQSLREYIATHAHERLLSIDLLKRINKLGDQIDLDHKESLKDIRKSVEQIENARAQDVKYFMNKKIITSIPELIDHFRRYGLAGMLKDKASIIKLFKQANRNKDLRIAISQEIIQDIVDRKSCLINFIMQDNQLEPLFQQLSKKNRNVKKLIDSYHHAVNQEQHKRLE